MSSEVDPIDDGSGGLLGAALGYGALILFAVCTVAQIIRAVLG